MCVRSRGPESGGTGTTAAPASIAPTTATTVSALAVACTATTGSPRMSSATAFAQASSRSGESVTVPTRIVSSAVAGDRAVPASRRMR